ALQHVAVEVDPDDVVGTELRPGEQPGIAEQGAVALVHRDVAGEVVVVPLVPERASEEHDLLPLGEVGRQPVRGGVEAHRGLQGRRTRTAPPYGSGARAARTRPPARRAATMAPRLTSHDRRGAHRTRRAWPRPTCPSPRPTVTTCCASRPRFPSCGWAIRRSTPSARST